jgi:hypothetical protein
MFIMWRKACVHHMATESKRFINVCVWCWWSRFLPSKTQCIHRPEWLQRSMSPICIRKPTKGIVSSVFEHNVKWWWGWKRYRFIGRPLPFLFQRFEPCFLFGSGVQYFFSNWRWVETVSWYYCSLKWVFCFIPGWYMSLDGEWCNNWQGKTEMLEGTPPRLWLAA